MARRNGFQHHDRCTNCRRKTIDGRRRCNRCSMYLYRHGVERPQVEGELPRKVPIYVGQLCVTCLKRPAIAKFRCNPCYQAKRRAAEKSAA